MDGCSEMKEIKYRQVLEPSQKDIMKKVRGRFYRLHYVVNFGRGLIEPL